VSPEVIDAKHSEDFPASEQLSPLLPQFGLKISSRAAANVDGLFRGPLLLLLLRFDHF